MGLSCKLDNTVTFEPVGNVTNVFFDEKNEQVFSVRSGGATGILIRGFSDSYNSTFRLEDKGPIIAIKLSPDQTTLAIQRQKNSVHFLPVISRGSNGMLDAGNEYSQACKSKHSNILGFYWVTSTEIVFITTQGLEVYCLFPEKKSLKYLRSINHPINWFVFCSTSFMLVTSNSTATTSIQPFVVKPGSQIIKLAEVEFDKHEVREKDVHLVTLYNQQYVLAIMHASASASEIQLFQVSKDGITITKSHVLKVPFEGGGIAINVTDNVVMVHNRPGGKTALFDIALNAESDGTIAFHNDPVVPLIQVEPSKSAIASLHRSGSASANLGTQEGEQGYSRNWVTFTPDIVIDAKEGIMWRLKLKLDSGNSKQLVSDLPRLVGFLQQREGAKLVLLDVLLEWCSDSTTDLPSIGAAFNLISHEYRQYLDTQMMANMALPVSSFLSGPNFVAPMVTSTSVLSFPRSPSQPGLMSQAAVAVASQPAISAQVILDEADIYTNLFSPLVDEILVSEEFEPKRTRRVFSIVMEYIRSLEERQIPIQHFLNELLINLLVRQGSFFLLHQLLQYHVISDSKPLACLLLSLENVYPASYQLALDMLVRLKNSSEEICEILLSKGNVLSAIRFASKSGIENNIPAQKFLEASKSNPEDFYTVFTYLQERHLLPRNCQEYKEHFQKLFGKVTDSQNN